MAVKIGTCINMISAENDTNCMAIAGGVSHRMMNNMNYYYMIGQEICNFDM